MEKNDENKLLLLMNILSENKMPKRYYKIENIIDNNYINHDIKIKVVTNILLLSLKEMTIMPIKLLEKFLQ